MFHKTLEEGNAGDQMGVLVKGIKRTDVTRGMCLIKPGSAAQHDHVTAQVEFNMGNNAVMNRSITLVYAHARYT